MVSVTNGQTGCKSRRMACKHSAKMHCCVGSSLAVRLTASKYVSQKSRHNRSYNASADPRSGIPAPLGRCVPEHSRCGRPSTDRLVDAGQVNAGCASESRSSRLAVNRAAFQSLVQKFRPVSNRLEVFLASGVSSLGVARPAAFPYGLTSVFPVSGQVWGGRHQIAGGEVISSGANVLPEWGETMSTGRRASWVPVAIAPA